MLIVIAGVLLALGKGYIIGNVGLFQDEVFYWLESERPGVAYSDLPLMTAWLIRLGTSLLGDTPAGVRLVFYLLGISLPLAMYWLARPVVGERHAVHAAGLCLAMPLLAFMGAIAGPDVALVLLNLLALGSLVRALQTRETRFWVLTGVFMALGFAAHYRFAPFVAAGLLYFVTTRHGRTVWKDPGVYLAAAIAFIGVLPTLYFNLVHDGVSVGYHLVDRHSWEFDTKGFLFPFEQALIVSPLLYGLLVYALIKLAGLARKGDSHATLFLFFVVVQAGVYYLLSPFMDQSRVSYHWPLSGYLPLLVYLPVFVARWFETARSPARRAIYRPLVVLSLSLAGVVGVTLLTVHGLQSRYAELHPRLNPKLTASVSNFAGWREMADRTQTLLDASGPVSLLIGEHYVVAAQMEFHLDTPLDIYSLGSEKPAEDGRALQLRLWDRDREGVEKRGGENALITLMTVERRKYSQRKHRRAVEALCSLFTRVEKLDQMVLWGGVKGFEFYHAVDLQPRELPRAECLAANLPLHDWDTRTGKHPR